MFNNLINGLCDLVYPRNCLICQQRLPAGGREDVLCQSCQGTIEINKPPFCFKCSRHLESGTNHNLCRECLHEEHHFDRAWAATFYNKNMQTLIHMFKYQSKTSLRNSFTKLMSSFMRTYQLDRDAFDVLAPIPLHQARLRERGYNQSELLSQGIAKEFNIKESRHNLLRARNTANQALLGKKERWTNIEGAFKIKDSSQFSGKSVLIIDDLLTTGATASEVARLLKENGARKVSVLTLAIAV